MITKLELTNFQKHSHLEINFTQGVNVIFGQTDAGKSCVRRALSWIFFNEPKGDVIRKTGTKKTSAKITLDNGVQVERLKSSSVNAYILYIKGCEEKRFDAINKGIPEEVLNVLKTTTVNVDNDKLNLNIANQIALPFLLDKPATFRSKLFNKLTGSDIVDKSLQGLNKDILQVGREEKTEKKNVEEKEKQLEELTKEKEKTEKVYVQVSKIFTDLKEKQEKCDRLKDYLEKLINIKKEIKEINNNLKNIKLIDNQVIINLNNKIDKLNKYSEILNKLKINKEELENTNKEINLLKIPEIDINTLKNKIEKLNKLIELKKKIEDIKISQEKITIDIVKCKSKIDNGQIEYKELQKKVKICPIFGGAINEECLKRIK